MRADRQRGDGHEHDAPAARGLRDLRLRGHLPGGAAGGGDVPHDPHRRPQRPGRGPDHRSLSPDARPDEAGPEPETFAEEPLARQGFRGLLAPLPAAAALVAPLPAPGVSPIFPSMWLRSAPPRSRRAACPGKAYFLVPVSTPSSNGLLRIPR